MSPYWVRNSRYSLSTLQLTLALYIICVSLSGPFWARVLSMSICISIFDLRILSHLLFMLDFFHELQSIIKGCDQVVN